MIGFVAALPRNAEVADQFDLLADLLELEGAESFRVLAYRRAATRMRETSGSVAQLALDGRAKELQGIGKTIEEKIVQIVEQGEIEALAKRRELVPGDVVAFVYVLASSRFVLVLGALDTGSSFEGMGASREVHFAALAEPAFLLALAVLARVTGAFSLTPIYHAIVPAAWTTALPTLALVAMTLLSHRAFV